MNRVILTGILTDTPLALGGPKPAATFSLVLTAHLPHRDRTILDYVPVTAFGRTGQACLDELRRGSRVLLEGRLRLDRWRSPTYGPRSRLTVVAERIECLSEPLTQPAPDLSSAPAPREASSPSPQASPEPTTL